MKARLSCYSIALLILVSGSANFSQGVSSEKVRLIADLNPGAVGSFPDDLTAFGNALYFSAYTFQTGRELWKYDGTNVILVANINDTASDIGGGLLEGNDSDPEWFTLFNGALYFAAFDPRRGGELWRYDGSTAVRVADINPDVNDAIKPAPNNSWPNGLIVFNNALYFSANSGTIRENYELWKFDGNTAMQAANIHADFGTNHSSYPKELTLFANQLFFSADDGSTGFELWKHNGANTELLDVNPGGGASSAFPKYFTALDNHLYFSAYHDSHGFELWRMDGTSVALAADLVPGAGSSFPEQLALFKNALYFRATDGANGSELWKHDGIQATLVANIHPTADSYPKNLTAFGDLLCFAADDGVHGWELWKHDGLTTMLVADLNPLGDSFPEHLTLLDGVLYFVATTPDTGYELWKYDGSAVTLAADINPGPDSSFPLWLRSFNGRLFFSATDDGSSNWELWTLTVEGTANQLPVITLSSDQSGKTLYAPGTVILKAAAFDTDGVVSQVEFFNGATSIGIQSTAPYELILSDLAAATYFFTAVATDNGGARTTSAAVQVRIVEQPRITSISLTNEIHLAWLTTAGTTNYVQAANAASGPYEDVSGPIIIPGTEQALHTFTDPSGAATTSSRFYRVIQR